MFVSIHGHASITNAVRSSEYFQSIPPLSAECLELDGDASTLPIIFEDSYAEQLITSLATAVSAVSESEHSATELRRAATTNSQRSCSSQASASSRQSRMSLASTTSSVKSSGKLRVKPLRAESTLSRGTATDSLVATDQPDCTLVGYRKIDISRSDLRPTVELGTLTSNPTLTHTHLQALVGSGVVMQPSLLFNAVSLPILHTATTVPSNDMSVSMTGSMPTLAATDDCGSESELTPYWRSQQGKAHLVAQHSNEATAAMNDVMATGDVMAINDGTAPSVAVSNSVDFTVGGSELNVADDSDLDTTLSDDVLRAVGNDLYMAEGIDLDATVGNVTHGASVEGIRPDEPAAAAVCECTDDVTTSRAADGGDEGADRDEDATVPSAGEDEPAAAAEREDVTPVNTADSCTSSLATHEGVTSSLATCEGVAPVSDAAADSCMSSLVTREGVTPVSAAAADSCTLSLATCEGVTPVTTADSCMSSLATREDVTPVNAADSCTSSSATREGVTPVNDAAADSCMSSLATREGVTPVNAADSCTSSSATIEGVTPVNDAAADSCTSSLATHEDVTPVNTADSCMSSSATREGVMPVNAADSCTSSLTCSDSSEQLMAVTDKTSVDVSCTASLQLSAPADVNSDQSVGELKQSSPDNDVNSCQSVSDMVDELSVVIPSSCDSVSDDERYMSGQCTLMELITESNSTDERSTTQPQPPQRPAEPVRQRALGVSNADSPDREVAGGHAADKSRRLIAVVSDDTVQFIGAKEKLRRQLSYSGHFYRLSLRLPSASLSRPILCAVLKHRLSLESCQYSDKKGVSPQISPQ